MPSRLAPMVPSGFRGNVRVIEHHCQKMEGMLNCRGVMLDLLPI